MEEIIELSWKVPCSTMFPKEWIKEYNFLYKGKWRLNIEQKYRDNVYIYKWHDEVKDGSNWHYVGIVGSVDSAKRYCELRM